MRLPTFGIGGVVEGRAAKLRGPDDERVVQHAALFENAQQGGDGLIDILRLRRKMRGLWRERVGAFGDNRYTMPGNTSEPTAAERRKWR